MGEMTPSMFDERPLPFDVQKLLDRQPMRIQLLAGESYRSFRLRPHDDPVQVMQACIAEVTNLPQVGGPAPEKPGKPLKEKLKLQGREVAFPDVEPWPDPVDGASLLDEIVATYQRFVVLPPGGAEGLALWDVFAHAHDCFEVSPILCLKSPAMRCGKTTTLEVTHSLIPRPLMASNLTGPVLFRAIEKHRPALLIDEADSFVTKNEELRGILNSSHRRAGALCLRLVGEKHELRMFSTWTPIALSSIGSLAATLEDRAITILMRRRTKGERVEKVRLDRLGELEPLRRKAARWVADHADELRNSDPKVPERLDDRAADNWRPLLAIADVAGGEWPERARRAALALSMGRTDETGKGEQLLGDIRVAFDAENVDRFSSSDLVSALVEMRDRSWAEWSRGRPLTQAGLARLLKGFGIKPKDVRVGGAVLKGYERPQFEDAWGRYVADGEGAAAPIVASENGQGATGLPAPVLECRVVAGGAPSGKGDAWLPEEGEL